MCVAGCYSQNLFAVGASRPQRGFTSQATLFLASCEPLGIGYPDLCRWLQDESWRFPAASQHTGKQLYRIFDHYRNKPSEESHHVRASCAELLGLYVLLRHFAETEVARNAEIQNELNSFQSLCTCIDLILAAKWRLADPNEVAPQLERASARHLQLFQVAYGPDAVKPKHHWQLDMCRQIPRDGMILDAFIIERIHLQVKATGPTFL